MASTKSKAKRRGPGSGPHAAAARALGQPASNKPRKVKKTTERTLLQDMVAELSANKNTMKSIMETVLVKAKEGDKDMLAFIGRYMLGNGKVSLDELTNPPLIKKSR